jgi:penicillin-binding protein 1A
MSLPKTILSGTAVLAVVSSILGASITLSYVKEMSKDLPDISKIGQWQPKEGSRILADDGTVLGVHAKEYREFVTLDQIPPLVIAAFLSAEDGNFWKHKGVDPVGVARAFISNLKGGRISGGSTIDQQVIKNVVLTPERTMKRKIQEALLALKIDKEIGKDRILEIYLNEIYLGSGVYGVKAAANRYFGKQLDQLTPSEAAVLAGLPQAPSAGNPFSNIGKATERRNYVLDRMAKLGYVTPEDAARYRGLPLVTAKGSDPVSGISDPAYGYAEEAVRRLQVAEVGSDKFYSDGGDLKTTLKARLQKVVHEELRRGLVMEDRKTGWHGTLARGISGSIDWDDVRLKSPAGAESWKVAVVRSLSKAIALETETGVVSVPINSLSWTGRKASSLIRPGDAVLVGDIGDGLEILQVPDVQGAVVVMEPTTGTVMAMDGGFSSEQSEFNRATQAKRQPGSVFKPFVYLTALEMGYNAMSPVLDSPIELDSGDGAPVWRPQQNEKGLGLITLRRALEKSRNHATVRLLYDVGEEKVRETAIKVGLQMPEKATYAMALGTVEMSPLNVAVAYSAIANGGQPVRASFFKHNMPVHSDPGVNFDPVAVAQLSSILEGVTYAGTASRAFSGFKHPIAAKTGTTNGSRDVWFAAFGPKYVIVSWLGHDDYRPLHKGAAGGETVAPVVRRILDRSEGMIEFSDFTLPPGATTITADRLTGQVDPNGDVVEIIREGEEPREPTQQRPAEQSSEEGIQPAADEGTPASYPDEDEQPD